MWFSGSAMYGRLCFSIMDRVWRCRSSPIGGTRTRLIFCSLAFGIIVSGCLEPIGARANDETITVAPWEILSDPDGVPWLVSVNPLKRNPGTIRLEWRCGTALTVRIAGNELEAGIGGNHVNLRTKYDTNPSSVQRPTLTSLNEFTANVPYNFSKLQMTIPVNGNRILFLMDSNDPTLRRFVATCFASMLAGNWASFPYKNCYDIGSGGKYLLYKIIMSVLPSSSDQSLRLEGVVGLILSDPSPADFNKEANRINQTNPRLDKYEAVDFPLEQMWSTTWRGAFRVRVPRTGYEIDCVGYATGELECKFLKPRSCANPDGAWVNNMLLKKVP